MDAAYPLSGPDGPTLGLPYVLKAIPWARHAGCDCVTTTDGLHKPEGIDEDESMASMKRCYERIVECAEAYDVTVTIEVHGYFTTNPDRLAEMLDFVDSPRLRLNLDTGNSLNVGDDLLVVIDHFGYVSRIRGPLLVHPPRDHSVGFETQLHIQNTGKAPQQQSATDQENTGNGDLKHDQGLAQPCEPPASTRSSACVVQGRSFLPLRQLECRGYPDENA